MSERQTNFVRVWLPLLISLATNAVLFGIFYGKTVTEIANLKETDVRIHAEELTTDKLLPQFVTRAEFVQRTQTRDAEMLEIRTGLRALNEKFDRVLEAGLLSKKTGD
jgi:hypothetical protein